MKKNILIITDDVHDTLGTAIVEILARDNKDHTFNIINKPIGELGYDYIPPLDKVDFPPKITVPLYNNVDLDLLKIKGYKGSNYTPKKRKRK